MFAETERSKVYLENANTTGEKLFMTGDNIKAQRKSVHII